jgi:hypothetical protein
MELLQQLGLTVRLFLVAARIPFLEVQGGDTMKKFILTALTGAAIALAAPEFVSATPLSLGAGLSAAADNVSSTEQVRHHRWHRHHHWRHHRWHHRHHHRHHGRRW